MNGIATFFRESRVARFFIPFGLILIAFGVYVFIITNNSQDFIEVESIVSNVELFQEAYYDNDGNYVDATYNIKIDYTVDGKDYNNELNGMKKYNIGDKIKIYYNPKDPSQITQTKSLLIPIIMIVGGIAAVCGGTISAFNSVKRYKKMKAQERSWESGK